MKISASIYSDNSRPLLEVVQDLVEHHVDLLHVDCNDDLNVFKDIAEIRTITKVPIDLHVITDEPQKYFQLLRDHPVEYLTFQYESLHSPLALPSDIQGKKGLAITTETDVTVFSDYHNFDFILMMATTPGKSGGIFNSSNFGKIRAFRNLFPGKNIHVDGGVNGEVGFILRNMGVSAAVSGSYLFKAPSVGHALMDLTNRELESSFTLADFMIPLSESPVLPASELTVASALQKVEDGKLGFCLICDESQQLKGIVSNADIRKGFLKNCSDFSAISTEDIVNRNPLTLNDQSTVSEMIRWVRKQSFPISYIPVVDGENRAVGIVTFVNLIKGEL